MTPAEREARWTLGELLAIKAASKDEADAALSKALAGVEREMPLRGEPVLRPCQRHHPDEDIWVAQLELDLTFFQAIEPDDAKTRCSLAQTYFPGKGVIWPVPVNTAREARFEWPTDIFNRRPGWTPVCCCTRRCKP
jgi:hypothetical protein